MYLPFLMSLLAPGNLGPCRIPSLYPAQLILGRCPVHMHQMTQEGNVSGVSDAAGGQLSRTLSLIGEGSFFFIAL